MPNQPKTPVRGFRLGEEYDEARELADIFGDNLSDEVRAALKRYIKRRRRHLENMAPEARAQLLREYQAKREKK